MSRILLVEDDDRLRRALAIALRNQGHTIIEAGSLQQAQLALPRARPDCAVIDLGLPDGSGLEVITELRSRNQLVPIIVLSARREAADKIGALDIGADDYVTKPFGADELLARIRAALRRSERTSGRGVRHTDRFDVDLDRKTVLAADGAVIQLTPTEWGILECLVNADGKVVPGPEILAEVWGDRGKDQSNYLRVYIAQLRQKLEADTRAPRHLLTVSGVGYRFAES